MAKETLVRMLRHQLDMKRKDKVLILRQREQVEKALKQHQMELESEKQQAYKDATFASIFPAYLERMQNREQLLLENKHGLENHLNAIEDEIAQLFFEAKKYDILLEKETKKAKKALMKSEQKTLDELASAGFLGQEENV